MIRSTDFRFRRARLAAPGPRRFRICAEIGRSFNRKRAPTAGWSAKVAEALRRESPGNAGAFGFGSNDRKAVVNAGSISAPVLTWLIVAIGLFPVASVSAEVEPADRLLQQATDWFHRANELQQHDPTAARRCYREAADRFRRLREELGIRNGKLLYNLANAQLLAGDVGAAILSYRRALLFCPSDPNLQHNLGYARQQCVDQFAQTPARRALETVLFWHYDFSRRTRIDVFVGFYVLVWGLASATLFLKRTELRWAIPVCATIAMLFGASLLVEAVQSQRNQAGVILATEIVARQGDGLNYQPAFETPLHAGTEFTLAEQRASWWRIALPDGRSCWIPSQEAGLVADD